MKLVNSNPDKFVIECIEIDLYDILYKAYANRWDNNKTHKEVDDLLEKYLKAGVIKSSLWGIALSNRSIKGFVVSAIEVEVHLPRKTKIVCKMP